MQSCLTYIELITLAPKAPGHYVACLFDVVVHRFELGTLSVNDASSFRGESEEREGVIVPKGDLR